MSVDPSGWPAGLNTMFDYRDGAPFFNNSSQTALAQTWPVLAAISASNTFRPDWTIQWMLGDQPAAGGTFDDVISAPESLRYDGPYILISAGPDGPNRANGGYCNFADPATGNLIDPASGNQLTQSQLLQMFINSGNVYNFDHP